MRQRLHLRGRADLFRRLTLGSFERIASDFDAADRQILVGVRPVKGLAPSCCDQLPTPLAERVSIAGMSDGTRDQLHLALRLAAIERHLDKGEPLPLLLDDVLVHVDDDRARAALEILCELSAKTQVLFFTHHSRLVELAQLAGGARVKVHALTGRG